MTSQIQKLKMMVLLLTPTTGMQNDSVSNEGMVKSHILYAYSY